MLEHSSSSKFLKKYYSISSIDELLDRLSNLTEEKFEFLEIKEHKYNRSVKWNNEKINLAELLKKNLPKENKRLIISLISSMLRTIDTDANTLSEVKEMKSPGSIMEGSWTTRAYSVLLSKDRKRRDSLRHILDQLLL